MAIYIYCHLDLLEIFMYWPFDIISEGLTFYMALENLRAGQVTPVPPSSDVPVYPHIEQMKYYCYTLLPSTATRYILSVQQWQQQQQQQQKQERPQHLDRSVKVPTESIHLPYFLVSFAAGSV